MIWKFWPHSKLQGFFGVKKLNFLQEILSSVDPDPNIIHFATNKIKLANILSLTVPENYFHTSDNLKLCIYYLPKKEFDILCRTILGTTFTNHNNNKKLITKILHDKIAFIAFLKLFDLPHRFVVNFEPKVNSYEICVPPSPNNPIQIDCSFKRLKQYQSQIFEQTLTALTPQHQRVIVQMPTGSGKTRTAMEIIAEYFINSEKSCTIFWLANSTELCEQSVQCFCDTWKFIGNGDVAIHRCWEGNTPPSKKLFDKYNKNFVVCGFQSLWSKLNKNKADSLMIGSCNLLVVDEAHISVATTYKACIDSIVDASNCRVLGLTATPGRSSELESKELSKLFRGKLISLSDPNNQFDNPIIYLRSKHVLSNVKYRELESSEIIKLTKKDISSAEYSKKILERLGSSIERIKLIARHLIMYLKDNKKIILFAPTKSSSEFLSFLFTYMNFKSAHIDGNTPSRTRRLIISDFNKGNIQIISNYGVLTTGFDSPKIDLVCIARPTKSPVLYCQMIGRGLRGPAVGGTDDCIILEVKDTFEGMKMDDHLYNLFSDYW